MQRGRVLLAFHLPRPAHESVPQEGGTPAEAGTGDEPNGRLANSQVVSGVLIKEIHMTETPRRRETPPQPTAAEREVLICSRSRPIPTRPERPGSRAALVPHLLARPLRRALHARRRPRPSLPDPRPARGFQRHERARRRHLDGFYAFLAERAARGGSSPWTTSSTERGSSLAGVLSWREARDSRRSGSCPLEGRVPPSRRLRSRPTRSNV